jgi:hypothetical protein
MVVVEQNKNGHGTNYLSFFVWPDWWFFYRISEAVSDGMGKIEADTTRQMGYVHAIQGNHVQVSFIQLYEKRSDAVLAH